MTTPEPSDAKGQKRKAYKCFYARNGSYGIKLGKTQVLSVPRFEIRSLCLRPLKSHYYSVVTTINNPTKIRAYDEVPEEKLSEIAEAARVEIELGRSAADVRQMVAKSLRTETYLSMLGFVTHGGWCVHRDSDELEAAMVEAAKPAFQAPGETNDNGDEQVAEDFGEEGGESECDKERDAEVKP